MVADNYGDPTTCLAEIQFFGVGKCPPLKKGGVLQP